MLLASQLVLTRLAVPPMPYPAINNPDTPQSVSSVEQLILRGLSATPRETSDEDGSHEHDCAPFFCSLETGSRVWHDFIQSLAFVPNRYPLLTQLELRKISFHGMSYSFTAILLGAFPALRTLNFSRCSLDAREDLISVLELNPSLCPELKDLRDGDTVIPRDDPLPLRDYMYF
ncbi:hypothetical protein B0H11DRAFT_2252612 [Mycena galericulata]|nr:hypothetical protein B0H11DRAFT_2252612 [Mycena galericulata]